MTKKDTLSVFCKSLAVLLLGLLPFSSSAQCGNLYISSLIDGPLSGGTPKGVQFCASGDIADLSTYGFGSANNGQGTDGEEFTFPMVALSAGQCIWVASETAMFTAYFGFAPDYTDAAANINGDDAIELFCMGVVEDLFGDINTDGTGECWEHLDGYAINNNMMPNFGAFSCASYTFSGINVLDGTTTVDDIAGGDPFPTGGSTGTVCSITNVAAGAVSCSGDNAEFSISFTVTDGSGNYDVVDGAGNTLGTGTASPLTATVVGPTTAGNMTINIVDAADATCMGTAITVAIPTCPSAVPCPTLAAAGTNPTSCGATDGSIALTTTNVPDGTYTINYLGGSFANITITAGAGTISGLGDGTYDNLTITIPGCTSTEDVDIALAAPPSLANVVSTPTCNSDGTYCVDVAFDATSPANTEYTVDINGIGFGPFAYVAGTAQSAIALCDASFVGDSETGINVTVTDGSAGGGGGGNNFGPIFISELHYDNAGIDEGELVEVTAPAGTDLSAYTIVLYNGNGGTAYSTVSPITTAPTTVVDAGNGCGTVVFDVTGIQNGAPDGVALVDASGVVVEFISYEGDFMATDGPASGMMSTDIGVFEPGAIGESLQLTDAGWDGPIAATTNAVNLGLSCPSTGGGGAAVTCTANATFDEAFCPVVVCEISNVTATSICNPFGGFDLELCFDFDNPDGPDVTVIAGGQNMGVFPYPTTSGGCILIQGIESNPSEWSCDGTQGVLEVEVFDNNTTFEGIPFISEFHYDNGGTDENEFIEITAGAGVDVSAYQIELYNGNGGVVYSTIPLPSQVITDQGFGCGSISVPVPGIQNGGPDGFALVEIATGNVLDFVSYEGVMEATNGSAVGLFSTDVLVSESAATTSTQSIELTDSGWAVADPATPGVLNANISSCLTPVCSATTTVTEPDCCPAPQDECGSCVYYLYLHDAVGNGWDGGRLMVSINEEWPATEYKLTVADGQAQYYPLPINDGGTIDVMYMNGANSIEHSYQILDQTGAVVFQDGGLYTGGAPAAAVNQQIKAECPECCQEEDEFTIAIFMGSSAETMSWELTDGFGDRVSFANAGDYTGFTPGSLATTNVTLEGCNDYRFTAFSAANNGWQGGSWQIISSDPTRGTLIVGGPFNNQYLVSEGPCLFGEETTSLFTLPCHTTCPDDETVVADDIAGCAITTYTPPTIEPFVCYPNSCHANDITVTVGFPTAVGGAVSGPQGTTSAALPVGTNPVVYETTYADGQIVRCTMLVYVIADANPTLTCNDNVIISLPAENSSIPGCDVVVTPDMVLEDPGFCHEQYTVVVFDLNGNSLGNEIGPNEAGQTLTYTVQHIGATGNLCWGTLVVEDKYNPFIACTDYTIACNHPEALDENWMHTENFEANPADLPANIAGGTAAEPSETALVISGECTPLGEIIQDINVTVALSHNDVEDLEIQLVTPGGDTLILMAAGTCNNQGVQDIFVQFDSEAGPSISGGCSFNFPGISGAYEPVDNLNVLYGLPYTDFAGDWQILVYDNDATPSEGIGFGQVQYVEIEVKVGFPTPYAAFDCTLQGVELINEMIAETDCDQSEWAGARILRTWQAVDAFGNSSTCLQTVNLQAPMLDQISVPADVQLECGQAAEDLDLDLTGTPHFDCFDLLDEHHNLCDISYTYEDQILPTCGQGYKIIRTWTVLNWCSGNNHYFEQLIKVEDTIGPSIDADAITMSTDEYACSTSVTFEGAITDDCSDIQQVTIQYVEGGGVYNQSGTLIIVDITNGESIDNLPLGTTEVTISAKDICGNETSELLAINVVDTRAPVAICDDELHISLGSDGTARVYAEDIDEGSYDNCSDITIEVRRSGCESSSWGPYVDFACCDVDDLVEVRMRVTDAAGNSNECWKEVLVEDALPPVITCPADKTLTCDDDAVHDPFGEAEAFDNCDVDVDFVDSGELDQCRAGTLTRTWTATDGSDKSPDVSCSQEITVEHVSDFVVQFPADVTLTNCAEQDAGAPSISDDDCELLAISADTLVLDIVDDACYKLEITWTVINWCIYDQDNPNNTDLGEPQPLPRTFQDDDGYFQYTQIVKILDNDAPVIDCPDDLTFCDLTDACEGQADLTISATDACSPDDALEYTYKIDAFNDGTFDIVDNGNDASGVYPYGTHKIKWIVEDGCGNTSSCEYLFTVEDCKNPTPVCLNGITIENMQTGCVDIWASDLLEYAFDNCSDAAYVEGSVKMRREGAISSPQTAMTLCCEDLGTVIVEIWVEDEAGNADYCTTYIIVQDNLGGCEDTEEPEEPDDSRMIAGKVETESGTAIPQTTMTLSGTGLGFTDSTTETDAAGNYTFNNLPNGTYQVDAYRDLDPTDGVSTYDLVLMSQHILGMNPLDSPYKMIAADVNNDGNITTFDIVQTRQLILFIITDFPSNTSWRFVDKNYVFPVSTNPWQEVFPEEIEYNFLNQNQLQVDFIGVKIGDLDGNASANNLLGTDERNKVGTLNFLIENETINAGQTTTIDFRASDFSNISGYQFTLNFDANALEFIGVEKGAIEVSESNFGMSFLQEGVLTASWNKAKAATLANDEILFSLRFTANQAIQTSQAFDINSRYTQAEAYQNGGLLDVALDFQTEGESLNNDVFELHQNTPNPFKGETIIGFDLPTASTATLKVYDVAGKVLKIIDGTFALGYNQISLNSSDLQGSGVLYYQLDTPTHSATTKMIVLE